LNEAAATPFATHLRSEIAGERLDRGGREAAVAAAQMGGEWPGGGFVQGAGPPEARGYTRGGGGSNSASCTRCRRHLSAHGGCNFVTMLENKKVRRLQGRPVDLAVVLAKPRHVSGEN